MQTTIDARDDAPLTWTPWVNVAVGIAAIITPFIGAGASNAFRTSNVITGIIIVIVALVAFFASQTPSGINIAIINILAGIWLVISTSLTLQPMLVWENVVLGVIAVLIAIISMAGHKQLARLTVQRSEAHGA